ncbi:calcium/sodium antiporter [Psychrobacter sp. DAB_AL62B]|uniref:calcium/sodium antiporter n=1 Tax=Psychrobacter sp. DAB_AL62B TaxID=1028420 RepID=UPI0023810BEE|nr:calcium/sodium antiporter [Psychrobacter sp. DAB_AL62B]MDE4454387.1 calcium/sodium antiporter [Psychrobacter sp. DAB_AL62B]
MWLAVIAVLIGLTILVWSADVFIEGATTLANHLRVPSFLVGVVILGLGTSAPEMVVSVLAALQGSPELALGNAYGSNIMNIALVLGITALISPIIIHSSIVKRDLPLLLVITILAAWQLRDGQLSQTDGVLLLLGLLAVLTFQIIVGLREGKSTTENRDKIDNSKAETAGLSRGLASLVIGMSILVLGSRAIVWGAVELATYWGLSELIIGLTIVAVGTSLPELVASLSAARKGEHDMALGNIIGSNTFNTLGVVGLAALIAPIQADPIILSRDVLAMGLLTTLLVVLSVLAFISKRQLGRISGSILLLFFIGYTILLAKTFNL